MKINVNALIDMISLLMVLCIFVNSIRQKSQSTKQDRLFWILMVCICAVFLLDIPAWILDGKTFAGARIICFILDTCYNIMQIIYCYLWVLFVERRVSFTKQSKRTVQIITAIPLAVELILILVNIQTGIIFIISRQNVYSRGDLFTISMIPYYGYIVYAMILAALGAWRSQNTDMRRQSIYILFFMFLPICGMLIESLEYGVSWLWPFAAISLLMIYLNMQISKMSDEKVKAAVEAQRALQLEQELKDSRVKKMLSQIQPHFLYNSLSVIEALCSTKPDVAAKAITDFSSYLRCNINVLKTDKLVPFHTEWKHIGRYLALEKLRFQERLLVEYDIQTEDFMLPTLTVEPIVENMVRYGVSKREEGGTLYISTHETDKHYVITVKDNGIGFEPQNIKNEKRTHVGIANVTYRLRTMCNGTLTIQSEKNVGTTVVIRIPKE